MAVIAVPSPITVSSTVPNVGIVVGNTTALANVLNVVCRIRRPICLPDPVVVSVNPVYTPFYAGLILSSGTPGTNAILQGIGCTIVGEEDVAGLHRVWATIGDPGLYTILSTNNKLAYPSMWYKVPSQYNEVDMTLSLLKSLWPIDRDLIRE
jgi:hypothetical protein